MEWYFVENAEQKGPVSKEEFDSLISTGQIHAETIVWHEGLERWQPLGFINPSAPPPPYSVLNTCSECGKIFPDNRLIRFEKCFVCAQCKPRFFQRVKQSVKLPGVLEYAQFGSRLIAKIIDGAIVGVFYGLVLILSSFWFLSNTQNPVMSMVYTFGMMGFQFGSTMVYTVFFHGKYGATLGKLALGLRVVMADGSKITYGMAAKRYFAELLSAFSMYIGYLLVLFDEERRSLHDRICDTRVIRK